MIIETKHNIEEVIWMLEGHKAVEAKISSIEIICTFKNLIQWQSVAQNLKRKYQK